MRRMEIQADPNELKSAVQLRNAEILYEEDPTDLLPTTLDMNII